MDRYHFIGVPYAPGCAQGKAKRDVESITSNDILIATQQELLSRPEHKPAGFIVVNGAPFSHAMIQLLSLGIPVVILGVEDARQLIDGVDLQIDGSSGDIHQIKLLTSFQYKTPDIPLVGQAVKSADSENVYLHASISNTASAAKAVANGAFAIGLVRTEYFQPPQSQVPDREFYTKTLSLLCEVAKPLMVTIRLLDLAPDKQPAWLSPIHGMQGPMGLQGIRLYKNELIKRVVYEQVAAIDHLAEQYDVRMTIPYVTTYDEFRYWYDAFKQRVTNRIPIGAMVETPAALLDIKNLLKYADFVLIGTNDLMQCLFAADRKIHELCHYLNPYAPLLFRLLQTTAREAGNQVSKIQLCGLLAQWPGILPVLLGLGYRTFSVDSTRIPDLAQTIKQTNIDKAQHLAQQVCAATDSQSVCKLLEVPLPSLWSR